MLFPFLTPPNQQPYTNVSHRAAAQALMSDPLPGRVSEAMCLAALFQPPALSGNLHICSEGPRKGKNGTKKNHHY